MQNILDLLSEFGRKVDPIIIKYLKNGAYADFVPAALYQIKSGGKRVRSALTLLSCKAVNGKISEAIFPAAIFELIHNYSLIMDDIIDRGEIRRGSPTTRSKFGDDIALLAGMFYREVIGDIIGDCYNGDKIQELVIRTIKETIEGERLDILFEQIGKKGEYIEHHRFKTISNKSYQKLIGKKTATLMSAACQAGAIVSDASQKREKALSDYGWYLGLTFQITDDILDIFGEKTGKQRGKDIIEHKLGNAVIMLAFQEMNESTKMKLLNILRKPKVDQTSVKKAIRLIETTNAQESAYKLANKYAEKSKKILLILPESKARRQLCDLADFIVNRLY
ncbi:MAG: polyprenyl synthetase family protein [Candidatus Bathyarchaeota archaeon]|nr:polyprenyl synthetase family protein [Candidatus Bathyarchaeota archaeon]MCZ2844908.1 polyprenyl synthetase family protein [Candidatus Bathyarchaeota archaeon]